MSETTPEDVHPDTPADTPTPTEDVTLEPTEATAAAVSAPVGSDTPAGAPEPTDTPAAPETPATPAVEPTVEPTPVTTQATADASLASVPGDTHTVFDQSAEPTHPNADVETFGSGTNSVPVVAEDTKPVSAYQEAVRDGVNPQAATHLATVPTIATAVGPDGTARIVDVNVDPSWKPAPVESDPAERDRLEKAQAALEAKLEGNTRLLG